MSFANTFITLSDVDITSLSAGKFLQVRPSGNVEISQVDIQLDTLTDTNLTGAYAPATGQTLVYGADNKWTYNFTKSMSRGMKIQVRNRNHSFTDVVKNPLLKAGIKTYN